jgi:hypothetical protein
MFPPVYADPSERPNGQQNLASHYRKKFVILQPWRENKIALIDPAGLRKMHKPNMSISLTFQDKLHDNATTSATNPLKVEETPKP